VYILNNTIKVVAFDFSLQDDFDHLRPLCYPGTDVFLLCFSVVNPTSFHNIAEKWAPELKKKFPKIPIILVGTLCDLRDDVRELIQLDKYNERPVTEEEAEAKANEIDAMCYIECSALTQKNMKEVFDTAIFSALEKKGMIPRSSGRGLGSKRWKKYRQNHTVEIVQRNAPSENENGFGVVIKENKTKKGWKKFCCFA
jgi:small GTP-binding protein